MASLFIPWIVGAALNGGISNAVYAQIIEYLKHPCANATTATVYLSDTKHYIETVFTMECIQELEKSGTVTSLGSIRGSIISVQEAVFYPTPSCFVCVVTKAQHVGMDGTCTIKDPVNANEDSKVKELLKSCFKKDGNCKNPVVFLSSSTLLAINELTNKTTQNKKTNIQGLVWDDCIIPDDQQKKLDLIWADSKQDSNIKSIHQQSESVTKNINVQMLDFYEYIRSINLDFDTSVECDSTCTQYLPNQLISSNYTKVSSQLISISSSQYSIHSRLPSYKVPQPNFSNVELPTNPSSQFFPQTPPPISSDYCSQSTAKGYLQSYPQRNVADKQCISTDEQASTERNDSDRHLESEKQRERDRQREREERGGRFSPLAWLPASMRVQIKHVKRKHGS